MAEERARLPPDFENSKKQTQAVSTYAPPSSSSSLHMQKTGSFHTEVSQRRGGGGGPPLGAYLSMSGAHRPDGVGGGSSKGVQFTNVIYESGSAHADDLGEEGSKKKKVGFLFSFVKNPGFLNRSFQKHLLHHTFRPSEHNSRNNISVLDVGVLFLQSGER